MRVQLPLRVAPHPNKVLIPPWVGELVAAKLRIYRRQVLATGRPILTSRINHGPASHRDNRPEERNSPPCGTTAKRTLRIAVQTLKEKKSFFQHNANA
uniref:Uncharacterized protein n=1 Tax=Plectus sambesii TaxID=2011161 RepID=A0A914W6K1_9BILA